MQFVHECQSHGSSFIDQPHVALGHSSSFISSYTLSTCCCCYVAACLSLVIHAHLLAVAVLNQQELVELYRRTMLCECFLLFLICAGCGRVCADVRPTARCAQQWHQPQCFNARSAALRSLSALMAANSRLEDSISHSKIKSWLSNASQ